MIHRIKKFVRRNTFIMNAFSFIYRAFNGNRCRGGVQVVWDGCFIKKSTIKCTGRNCKVYIAPGCRIVNLRIYMFGDNNTIYVDEDCVGKNIVLWCSDGGTIKIGKRVYFTGNDQFVANEGKKIIIGDGCLFADNITFRTGDSHAIYNSEGERLNRAKNIHIGEHVWFASGVTVLKGAEVEEDCVVGTNSIVVGKHYEAHSLIVGIPSKIVKENIHWEHDIPK